MDKLTFKWLYILQSFAFFISCNSFLLSGEVTYQSPLTPAELLIALHNLDDKVDMKTTIKGVELRPVLFPINFLLVECFFFFLFVFFFFVKIFTLPTCMSKVHPFSSWVKIWLQNSGKIIVVHVMSCGSAHNQYLFLNLLNHLFMSSVDPHWVRGLECWQYL